MAHYFTEAENHASDATRPTKQCGVMTAFISPKGLILIVKPNYKPGWSLVGGIVDQDEAPLAAAVRESTEEIGLHLAPERFSLLGVQYLPPGKFREFIRICFRVDMTNEEAASIVINRDELDDFRFVTLDELAQLTERPVTQGVHAMLTAANGIGYVEDRQLRGGS